MRRTQKFISVILALMMVLSIIPITASAASSGSCGANLTWSYNSSTYTLTISGTGDMKKYSFTNRPWESQEDKITTVVVSDGVTSIGDCAFYSFGKVTSITIPDSVTNIGKWAFGYCKELTTVTLPKDITVIREGTFYNCSSLTYLTIPANVTTIGTSAFEGCTALTSVNISAGVTSIFDRAFDGCSALAGVTVDADNAVYSSDEFGVLFNKDKTTLIKYFASNTATSYTIPNTVTAIASGAFSGCTNLTTIAIPESVKIIDSNAFANCTNLSDVTIFEGVQTIGSSAFSGCTSLSSITIPESVTTIKANAFNGTSLYNNTENWENNILYIDDYLIVANSPISGDLQIKDGTKVIAENAFYGFTGITSVTIPKSLKIIGSYAFDGCTSLKEVYFSGKASDWFKISIGERNEPILKADVLSGPGGELIVVPGDTTSNMNWVFDETSGVLKIMGRGAMEKFESDNRPWESHRLDIKEVIIEGGITTVGNYAFYECDNLVRVTLPNAMTSIGGNAFAGCNSLTDITLPETVVSINSYAFERCTSLPSINLENIKTIGASAFRNCISFTSVTISDNTTTIGKAAFWNCSNIESVSIGKNVTSIGEGEYIGSGSFDECNSVTAFEVDSDNQYYSNDEYGALLNKDQTVLMNYPLGNTRTNYIMPDSVTTIQIGAFYECQNLTTLTFSSSLRKIKGSAFYSCKVKDYYYPAPKEQWDDNVDVESPNYEITQGNIHFGPTNPEAVTGRCGENLVWTLNSVTGDMVITGTGPMYNYDYSSKRSWQYYLSSIKNVVISDGATTIGSCAFNNCTNLETITLPGSIETIGDGAFNSCNKLVNINVDSSNENYSNDTYGVLFNKDKTTLILYPEGNTRTSYTVPNTVKTIDKRAFYNCDNLTDIIISDGVTTIGDSAFASCGNLKNITIPATVTLISTNSIYGNKNVNYAGTIAQWRQLVKYNGKTGFEHIAINCSDGIAYPWGPAGENVTWEFNTHTNTITFTGTGKIYSYEVDDSGHSYVDERPWEYFTNIIENVVIGDGVTSIGGNAFYYCYNLKFVTIPSSVDNIYDSAFEASTVLAVYYLGTEEEWNDVEVSSNNEPLLNAQFYFADSEPAPTSGTCGENLTWTFDDATGILIISGTGDMENYENDNRPWENFKYEIKTVVISDGVTSVGERAFRGLARLESVEMADSVTTIGASAYGYCEELTDFTVGSGVESIGAAAFIDCSKLASITIPNSVTTIGYDAFDKCLKLKDVYFLGTEEQWKDIKILTSLNNNILSKAIIHYLGKHESAFGECGDNLTWHFDASTNTLTISGTGAMYDYDDAENRAPWNGYRYVIENIVVSKGVTTIGNYAFDDFRNLKSIRIVADLTSIGNNAFYDCTSLTAITIPDTVTTIGEYAFYNCTGLESITIPDGITEIKRETFAYCKNLKDVTFPDGLKEIKYGVFYECDSLTSVVIPEGVTALYNAVFYKCDNLTTVTIPNSVTIIGWDVFYECKNLETVYMGRGVKTISPFAFWECDNLKDVYYAGTEKMWNNVTVDSHNEGLLNATIHFNECEHFEYEAVVTAPTCTERGYTTYICIGCEDTYIADYVDATGHSFVEYEGAYTAPTCTEKGSKETISCCLVCNICLATETTDIPALGHTPADAVEENYIAPTCTTDGSKDIVIYCSVCGEEISRETVIIEKLGHADNDGDGYCDADNELLDQTVECECNCHKEGVSGFFWNIKKFFIRIFRTNQYCDCGAVHY